MQKTPGRREGKMRIKQEGIIYSLVLDSVNEEVEITIKTGKGMEITLTEKAENAARFSIGDLVKIEISQD